MGWNKVKENECWELLKGNNYKIQKRLINKAIIIEDPFIKDIYYYINNNDKYCLMDRKTGLLIKIYENIDDLNKEFNDSQLRQYIINKRKEKRYHYWYMKLRMVDQVIE